MTNRAETFIAVALIHAPIHSPEHRKPLVAFAGVDIIGDPNFDAATWNLRRELLP